MCAQCAFKYVQNLPGSQWVCVSRRSEDLDLLQMHQKKADCRKEFFREIWEVGGQSANVEWTRIYLEMIRTAPLLSTPRDS